MTNQGLFPKTDFHIDLEAGNCTCPAEQTTRDLRLSQKGGGTFHFLSTVCGPCPLRRQCVRGRGGRTIAVHPQEALLQQARAFQASPAFRECRARRQVVEHRLARLVQLGIRQARYCGRPKTRFQLLMAAAVANLTLLAAAGATGDSPLVPLSAVLLLIGTGLVASDWPPARFPPVKRYEWLSPILSAFVPFTLIQALKKAALRPGL